MRQGDSQAHRCDQRANEFTCYRVRLHLKRGFEYTLR